jgi:catechol 2,3-dioxygenase-like lactoylglutathione lyase family enzyme
MRRRSRRALRAAPAGGTEMQISASPVTVMLPVKDMTRARHFYEDQLALPPLGEKPDGKFVYRCGGTELALFPKPEGTKAEHTAVSFRVDDISAAIAELEGRGVAFADYDLPGLRTVDHVCVLGSEKAAWFQDPEGNILCLHEDIV